MYWYRIENKVIACFASIEDVKCSKSSSHHGSDLRWVNKLFCARNWHSKTKSISQHLWVCLICVKNWLVSVLDFMVQCQCTFIYKWRRMWEIYVWITCEVTCAHEINWTACYKRKRTSGGPQAKQWIITRIVVCNAYDG